MTDDFGGKADVSDFDQAKARALDMLRATEGPFIVIAELPGRDGIESVAHFNRMGSPYRLLGELTVMMAALSTHSVSLYESWFEIYNEIGDAFARLGVNPDEFVDPDESD